MTPENTTFHSLGITPKILEVLDREGFTTPTPIQLSSIPAGIDGKDIIGIAQTGTGKTLAFGIPMMQTLMQKGGRGLIILPTRELALQVEEALRPIGQAVGIGMAVFIGGASMHAQRLMLKRNPRILIVTPGRLIDHLERNTVTLHEVNVLILDEADRMLDMGFAPQVNKILKVVPTERQTMLFSATMPAAIARIAQDHMKLPLRVEVAPSGTTAARVHQEVLIVHRQDRDKHLALLLEKHKGSVLVFSRTKHGAKKLKKTVDTMGFPAAEIHANRSLPQRKEALAGFKSGRYRVLIATDIAARGIDVEGIELVVNYDLPQNPEDYVHRIGRTGRAGREGTAVSFALPDQRSDIRSIERLIRATLPITHAPGIVPIERVAVSHSPLHANRSTTDQGRRQRKWRRSSHRR
ncbi:MAG: DEAD/DEAH box helicase [Candidatus Peregrinibacteria bacterium]|nr:DEAD/DEAH box helicase [Candidatus Peregrinibacteria bacterium]